MNPILTLVVLGGNLVLLSGFVWLLYRLGDFHLTSRERRSWIIIGALTLGWCVLLALVGPLPPLISLLIGAVAIGSAIWAWRRGQFRLDAVPADSREEAARRREWMRTHRGLMAGIWIAFTVLTVVWVLGVVLVTR